MALGRVMAQSRVFYVTAPQKGALAEQLAQVESVSAEQGWHGLWGDGSGLSEQAKRMLDTAQMVVGFMAKRDPNWGKNIAALTGGVEPVILLPNPPADYEHHVTQWQIDQLATLPVLASALEQVVKLIRERGLPFSSKPATKSLLIHPGSGSEKKNWDLKHFLDVADETARKKWRVRFVLGEAEQERMSPSDLAHLHKAGEVVTPRSLVDLHRTIGESSVYLGNDTGPTHLAAMTGRATICLFLPEKPRHWTPIGPRVQVLSTASTGHEIAEAVFRFNS